MEIKVEDKIVMKKISEVKPYVRNPRKNDKTVDLLCKIIPKVGFNVPLVIDEKGIIVKGHARFSAAIKLGMTEIPCIVSHADPEAIKADRIADNKISEFSEWVNEELMHEIDMIDFDFDFTELGFPKVDFDDIPAMDNFEVEDKPEMSPEERQKLYEEFLQRQAEENAVEVQITSEKALNKAEEGQREIGQVKEKYYKFVCPKCGEVVYIRQGDLVEKKE